MPQHKLSAKLAALLLAIVALGIGHVGPATAQACAPNTCCATNPTTGTPACGAGVGNPLNVMSGNKFQREEDMPALPGVLGLELVRYYNSEASIADHRGILGRGWRLSYDAELVVQPGGNIITVHQGDGTQTDHANRDSYGDIISAKFDVGPVPDRGGNFSGPARIERMLRYFAEEANAAADDEVMQVDIIGFSRGAAEARDFANRLVANTKGGWYTYKVQTGQVDPNTLLPLTETRCQLVGFRFLGLWDTVLSTNFSLTAYNLAIPSQFSYVAQAVALNEYRSSPAGVNATLTAFMDNFPYWDNTRTHLPADNHYGGFPLESIGASSNTPGRVRIERGFIGAHADIGGGYSANENGLATVALSWMVAQAKIAGVAMNTQGITIDMNNPVIHDQSNALRVGNPLLTSNFQAPKTVLGINVGVQTYAVEDRQVNGGLGSGRQRGQTFAPTSSSDASLTNVDTHQFINYTPRDTAGDTRRTTDIPEISNLHNRTGTVDMGAYINWLRQHGYTLAGE